MKHRIGTFTLAVTLLLTLVPAGLIGSTPRVHAENTVSETKATYPVNGTMMQYFDWYVPNDQNHWNRLASDSDHLSDLGITAVWIPPAYKGMYSSAPEGQVGYGVYDMYDLGEFNQQGSVATKYGTKDQLKSAINELHNDQIQVYGDVVMNHRMGADGKESAPAVKVASDNRYYEYPGTQKDVIADTYFNFPGRATDPGKSTKFEWHWWHFDGVDGDNGVYGPIYRFTSPGKGWDSEVDSENTNYDYLMGADLDFDHPEVQKEMKDWGKWYAEELNLDGYRLDAVKHIKFDYLKDWVTYERSATGKDLFAVGEYWSGDHGKLTNFLSKTGNTMSLFDAPLHYRFYSASTNNGNFDLRTLTDSTLMGSNPEKAVTLVDNHDTQSGQALQSEVQDWFKLHAYNYILTHQEGYPTVFYKDYQNPALKEGLEELLHVRKYYAYGTQHTYRNTSENTDTADLVGWTREGYDERTGVASLISDKGAGTLTKWMYVGKQHAGQTWYDYTGNIGEKVVINQDGWAGFKVPGSGQTAWIPELPNTAPIIQGADDVTLAFGTTFDRETGVTARDVENGDLTDYLEFDGEVNVEVPGTYTLTYKVTDRNGLETVKERKVIVKENELPVLSGVTDTTLQEGTEFDPMTGITANDAEDGDLTGDVIVEGSVDTNVPGTYTLTYSVIDSKHAVTTAQRVVKVTAEPNTAPELLGIEDAIVAEGTEFDPMTGITANDVEDGDLTSQITVDGTVDIDTPGTYVLTYTVKDSKGVTTYLDRTITVIEKPNIVPTIFGVSDTHIVAGSEFNPLEGITASDAEDGDLTSQITVSGTVDVDTPGTYALTYTVKDSKGSTVTRDRIVTVDKAPLACVNNMIFDGAYRHYVNNCTDKVMLYTLEFSSSEANSIPAYEEAIKAYEYPSGTVYKNEATPQEMNVVYVFYMKDDAVNPIKKGHGVVEYAEKYNTLGQVVTYYEYYAGANYRSNNNLKIERILQQNTITGKLRSEERRMDGKTVPSVAFDFFGTESYVRKGHFDGNNNLKTTFKLGENQVIDYAYGKQTTLGYYYYYTYQTGTIYGQNHGSKILTTVVQKTAPSDMPKY